MLSRFWWEGGGAQMLLLVPHTTVIKTNKQREQTETKTSAWGGLSLSLSLYFSLSMCSFKCDLCSINFHSSSFFPLIPTLSHSHKRIFLSNLPKMCNGKTIFFLNWGGAGELILSIMQSRINFLNYFFSLRLVNMTDEDDQKYGWKMTASLLYKKKKHRARRLGGPQT